MEVRPHDQAVGRELEQSELAGLRRALAARSTLHMAEGALAVLGPLPIEDAGEVLADVALRLGVDALVVAHHVLDVVQGVGVPRSVADALRHVLAGRRV
ncbi:hypothetical protein [Streptomyces griseorubiginosus]|uniref:hypothetical protein n=1 Tax=Streptomyces griseorubiginosus TaxID=67304 RepID=UPI001AD79F4D|nr:hypothetical protein [Streptomyces griseorubiginosus]MBO4258866.1 hypothetical protein [Streptomyces griseorubiginosus]